MNIYKNKRWAVGRHRDIGVVRVTVYIGTYIYYYVLTICEKKNQITPRVICIILYCI